MSQTYLENSIRTCKTDVSNAERMLSDRFLNPKNTVCAVWNQLDSFGRVACPDSFYTKRAGCNSAEDRVGVENIQRPQYMQYISDSLGTNYNNNSRVPEGTKEGFQIMDFDTPSKRYSDVTGSIGLQMDSTVWPRTCGYDRYDQFSAREFARAASASTNEGYVTNLNSGGATVLATSGQDAITQCNQRYGKTVWGMNNTYNGTHGSCANPPSCTKRAYYCSK